MEHKQNEYKKSTKKQTKICFYLNTKHSKALPKLNTRILVIKAGPERIVCSFLRPAWLNKL